MSQIKAVLWDMDGVLVDSEWLVQEAFVEVMNRAGVMDNPAERYKETIGMNRETTLQWYMQFVDSKDVDDSKNIVERYFAEVGAIYSARMKADLRMKLGVVEALQCVQDFDLPQMVVTSTKHEQAVIKLGMFDLLDYFTDIVGGDQVSQGKPHPEPYLAAAQRLNIDISNCLVIEDSFNGIQSGLAAGAMVMHVPDLIPTDLEWFDSIYDALDSLESFPAWLTAKHGGDWV